MKASKYIWKNGEYIPWESATTHVLTHALHYGTAYFEGVRAYETDKGPAIFKHKEHTDRLISSAKMHHMEIPYPVDEIMEATRTLIAKNELPSCYIRPIAYAGYGKMGISPQGNPIDMVIAAWEWGSYLGDDGIKNGIRCNISSWARNSIRSLPTLSKCAANYANSILAKQESIRLGFDEAILLNEHGFVAEGPGENLFVVKDGVVYTPPISDSVLRGITAQTVIEILHDMGVTVHQNQSLTRDQLYTADELFFTGTAAEVTPIVQVDSLTIADGKVGTRTKAVQDKYFDIVQGRSAEHLSSLDFCS